MLCEKAIFLGDAHYPYVNGKVFNTALQIIKYIKPNNIFILGDWVDFYSLSKFRKQPGRISELQADINMGIMGLRQIRKTAPKAKIVYLCGNHEERLKKYLLDNPGLFGLEGLTIPALMDFENLNISYSEKAIKYNGLIIYHGIYARKHSGASARAEWEKWGSSGLSGHSHRIGAYNIRRTAGDEGWWECGCLCQRDNIEYDVFPNFTNGLCVGHFYGKHFQIEMVYINGDDGVAIWGGKRFA